MRSLSHAPPRSIKKPCRISQIPARKYVFLTQDRCRRKQRSRPLHAGLTDPANFLLRRYATIPSNSLRHSDWLMSSNSGILPSCLFSSGITASLRLPACLRRSDSLTVRFGLRSRMCMPVPADWSCSSWDLASVSLCAPS